MVGVDILRKNVNRVLASRPLLVELAMDQLSIIDFGTFKNQVVPFLPADLAAHYGTPAAWNEMSERVWSDLSAALPPDLL